MQQKQHECVTQLGLQLHSLIAITAFCKLLFSPPFTPWITFLLTLITSWVFPSHSHFDLVIIPTSSSSACLPTFTITPSLTSSHTAGLQQFKCHHPSNSLLTALNVFPSRPHPEVLSAACSVSPVSTNRLGCVCVCMFDQTLWRHVWNLWLIPLSSQMNPLNCALLLVLASLRNNSTLPLSFYLSHTHTHTHFFVHHACLCLQTLCGSHRLNRTVL